MFAKARFDPLQRLRRAALAMLLAFLCAVASRPANAELIWTQKSVELNATAQSSELEARYHFQNTGPAPVSIKRVESSCGCTTAALDRHYYEPGQSGDIVATFHVGSHIGKREMTIAVLTTDRPDPTTLTLIVHIPEILRLDPPSVVWESGAQAAPKTVGVEILQDTPIKDISLVSSNAGFSAELHPVVKGRKYEIVVRPTRTDQNLFCTLNIRCQFGDQEKTFAAYAVVRPPPPR